MPPFDLGTRDRDLERLLHRLTEAAADSLGAISRTVRFTDDEAVFMEGDEADRVFRILEGIVRVVRLLPDGRRQITGFLFPGDFLGVSFNRSAVYGYSAETVTAATIEAYARIPLERLIDGDARVRRLFLAEMSHELTAAQDRILLLAHTSAEERVASFVLRLADRRALAGPGEVGPSDILTIPMRWSDIGDYLGLTPETVSRSMAAFRREGLIYMVGRTGFRIVDRNGLRDRAGQGS